MERHQSGIYFAPFVVGDAPYCAWGWDLPEKNLELIESLSPEYFEHVATTHYEKAEADEKRFAAVAIRLAYGQALETYFALVCAAIQAPDCLAGWLGKYRPFQLRELVKGISDFRPMRSRLSLDSISWRAVSDLFLSCYYNPNAEKDRMIRREYPRTLALFAHDFVHDRSTFEYNALKHGLRVRPGGFTLALGRESAPGVLAPGEKMQSLGGSDFGASYLQPEKLSDNSLHFAFLRVSSNWVLPNMANGLLMLSMFMRNLLSFLRIVNGAAPETVKFSMPASPEDFFAPWRLDCGVAWSTHGAGVRSEDTLAFTKKEIVESYGEPIKGKV